LYAEKVQERDISSSQAVLKEQTLSLLLLKVLGLFLLLLLAIYYNGMRRAVREHTLEQEGDDWHCITYQIRGARWIFPCIAATQRVMEKKMEVEEEGNGEEAECSNVLAMVMGLKLYAMTTWSSHC
jgi:hypothetical protein